MAVVANLLAQIGADLTQFRLGMNEVDARIAQTAARSRAASNTASSYQAAAARAIRDQQIALTQRAAINFPRLNAAADVAREQVEAAHNRLAAAVTRQSQAVAGGAGAAVRAANTELNRATAGAERATARLERTQAALERANAKYEQLGRRAGDLGQRAAGMQGRAQDVLSVSEAQTNFQQAYAARLAQNALEYRNRALNAIAQTATKTGLAIEAALAVGAKVGADFNLQLTQIANNTSLSEAGIEGMRRTVRRLGEDSGADMRELAEGFRKIENFGYTGAQSAKLLEVAMKGAVAKGADMSTTADLLAGTMKNFKIPVQDAAVTMNFLMRTSQLSRSSFEEMAKAMGPMFATAANRHVSILDLATSYIVLTRHQIDANRAVNQFINLLNKTSAPTKQVQNALANLDKQVGTNLRNMFTPKGLMESGFTNILNEITKAANLKGVQPEFLAAKLFPNLRGTLGMTTLVRMLQEYKQVHKELGDTIGDETTLNDAYARTLQESGQQLLRLKNMAITFAADIATSLKPEIQGLIDKVSELGRWWHSLTDEQKAGAVKLAAWAGIALITVGVVAKLLVGLSSLKEAMITLGLSEATIKLMTVNFAAGFAATGVLALAAAFAFLAWKTGEWADANDRANKGIDHLSQNTFAEAKRRGAQAGVQNWDEGMAVFDVKGSYIRPMFKPNVPPPHVKTQEELAKEQMAAQARKSKEDLDRIRKEFGSTFQPTQAGPDPLADLYKGDKKGRSKKTEWDKAMDEANNFVERLQHSMFELNHEGNRGEAMWLAQTNVVLKSSKAMRDHAIAIAADYDAALESKKQHDALKESIKELDMNVALGANATRSQELAWRMAHGEFNKLSRLEKDSLLYKTRLVEMQRESADKIKEEAEANKELAKAEALVTKPLENEKSVFQDTLEQLAEIPEAMKKWGMLGVIAMAGLAQQNANAVKQKKDLQEAGKAFEELYIAQVKKTQATHLEEVATQLLEDRYKNLTGWMRGVILVQAAHRDKMEQAEQQAKDYAAVLADMSKPIEELRLDLVRTSDTVAGRVHLAFLQLLTDHKELRAASAVQTMGLVASLVVNDKTEQSLKRQLQFAEQRAEFTKRVKEGLDEVYAGEVQLGQGLSVNKKVWDSLSFKMQDDARKLVKELQKIDLIKQFAQGMEDIFMRSLTRIRDHGFRGFFTDVMNMFDNMLFEMAAKWAANQFTQSLLGGLGSLFGAASLGGGSNITSGSQIVGPLEGFASGGWAGAGRAIMVGERGPEMFVPGSSGSIVPNSELRGGDTHHWHIKIETRDADSFRRNTGQIGTELARNLENARRRNGG